jgi:hypothetical protein
LAASTATATVCYSQLLTFVLSLYLDSNTKRQTGRQAQLSNIGAARAVADIIRTTLGPRSMLKVSQQSASLAALFCRHWWLEDCCNHGTYSANHDSY